MSTRPQVALLLPYWSFWEESAGGAAFRREREALVERLSEVVESTGATVTIADLVDSVAAGSAVTEEIAAADVVVVAQTMAVPPAYALAALDPAPDVPLVVWALQLTDRIDPDFDEAAITSLGSTVGTPMLTNVLARRGRPHALVFGTPDSSTDRLARAIAAAATASALRGARLARIGAPLDGYECVDVDHEAIEAALGLEVLDIPVGDLVGRYRAAAGPIDEIRTELDARFEITDDVDESALDRTIGLAAALADLDGDHDVSMGAINCHVPELRYGDDPGVTACFALGRETSRGIPWTCVGDAITPVAMVVARHLGGAALYHEIEAVDFATGEVALANSGEHDLGWCGGDCRPRLVPNRWFESDPNTGPIAWFELPPGPASLIGFTPHADEPSGFRFVVAEGEITDRSLPRSPTVGGAFRFAGPVETTWPRWAAAGVNHHSAAAPGHLADQVELVARYLGVGCERVT